VIESRLRRRVRSLLGPDARSSRAAEPGPRGPLRDGSKRFPAGGTISCRRR
jgi:hypothetical protein